MPVHELSLCQSLISQVEAIADRHGASRVVSITLGIGPLSGVERDLLETAYPLASAGSVADQAHLEVESVPVRVRCRSCGAESEARPNRLLCGDCGDWQTDLVSGDEMLLIRVELDKPADEADLH